MKVCGRTPVWSQGVRFRVGCFSRLRLPFGTQSSGRCWGFIAFRAWEAALLDSLKVFLRVCVYASELAVVLGFLCWHAMSLWTKFAVLAPKGLLWRGLSVCTV